MISTAKSKKEREGLYLHLTKLDLITKIKPLLLAGQYHIGSDGKIIRRNIGMAHNSPWVFVKVLERRCDLAHNVFLKYFEMIPSYCRDCWKVVVRPNTLVELFSLYELQKHMDVEAKCGIEPRDTVHGLYGGYFYCVGKKQGLRRYKQVRKEVDEWLSPETSVILKRYCTEFEHELGPSDELKPLNKDEKFYEDFVTRWMPMQRISHPQPEYVQASVMREWIHHAYRNGDKTYKEFTHGGPLFPPLVTYHEEVKKDA